LAYTRPIVISNTDFHVIIQCITDPFFIGKESAPIQLAQCRFPGLAISNSKILIYCSNKNIRKQFYQTALGKCYGLKLPKF